MKIVNTVKLSYKGKDLRSKAMKNLKMILEDNKVIYTYSNRVFYVMIDSKETFNKIKEIYTAFNLEYVLVYIDAVVNNNLIDGEYIVNDIKMDLQLLARNSEADQNKLKIEEEEKTNMKNFTISFKNGEIIEQNTLTSVKQLIQLEGFKIDKVVNNLNQEVIYDNTNLVDALIKCDLVEDVESIEIDSNTITTDLGEYLVFYDYTEAEAEAIAQCKQIMEECGLTENLIFEAEIQGLIDTQWFIDYWQELHEFNAYEEGIQYIATDEEMEQLENGEISEEEIREQHFNSLQDCIKGQEMEEYKYQFGEQDFQDRLIKEGLIDIEALAQWCVDMDGVAHYLASYDGEEIEENGYYIYRTN